MSLPVIAVTLGDASGIGPELVARICVESVHRERCRLLVLGDPDVLRANVARFQIALEVTEISSLADARFSAATIEVLAPPTDSVGTIAWGRLDERAGRASLAAFRLAAELASSGQIDALLSAPVNKQALRLAGMTEADEIALLAKLMARPEPLLIGVLEDLLTVCVTLHVPLRDVPDLVTRERVSATATGLLDVLQRRKTRPRIAIAGLNPHAGDGGVFGREELDEIEPAVATLREQGADVIGPIAPDALFPQARAQGATGVVCMYHDQANIARKLAGIRGATLLVGLPVPIATTAHGTAYDRAGKGEADPASLALALDQLVLLAGAS